MTKPTLKFVNAETGEEIEREMNAAELKQYEADQVTHLARLAEIEKKAAAKTALLDRLGITADEALLLLS
jgi:hypothetical protein